MSELPRFDLSCYLVLDPDLCGSAAGMIDTTLAAVAGGATIVQLRAPMWKKRAMTECARELMRILRPAGVPLVIDDHADVAILANADGLHVGQQDIAAADARRLLGAGKIIGLSINTASELDAAKAELEKTPGLIDYIGVGPVFPTATKKDAAPALGIEGLRGLAAASPVPAVAIGGITAENAPALMKGAAGTMLKGVAVVSAVCGKPDPESAVRELAAAVDNAR